MIKANERTEGLQPNADATVATCSRARLNILIFLILEKQTKETKEGWGGLGRD